ncbi:MAG TPA: serine/threonine-protein kinase [Gemmatimonadaceae bacterium]|nr:serine/threonine-protein kinase [Gemmatimonadaceae bacterium]
MPERYLGQTLGKYRIESLLGSGGFAWVFKGYDPELDIPVAIKVLKPQFAGDQAVVDRFKREASTAAKLRHPNIIKIYAVGRENDAVYFVMDYLPSGLANRLETTQSLPEDYVLRVGVDVARALGFAHREGVIHRDIKVDNILFDTHGNAVVADFGIARAVSGYTNQTGTNMVVGTPQYFAPEQARAKPLDGRADLYSLGVTLFRSATGRLPFEGEDWYEIARQHVEEPAPPARSVNPALSPEFEAVVLQCMAKSADDRPATGDILADTLNAILQVRKDPSAANTVTVPTTPTGTTPRVNSKPIPQPVARRRLWTGAVVTTLLLGAIAALFALPFDGALGTAGTTPDSLPPDTVGQTGINSGTIQDPPLPAESLPPGRSTGPGRGTTAPATRENVGSISIKAPPDAQVNLNDRLIGFGDKRIDSLPPGTYLVSAELPTLLEGCTEARKVTPVRVGAGSGVTVTLTPRLCGTLDINVIARRNNQNVEQPIWYSLQPEGGEASKEAVLTRGPKVLTVGRYRLKVRMVTCGPFDDMIEILAGESTRVPIVMDCPSQQ